MHKQEMVARPWRSLPPPVPPAVEPDSCPGRRELEDATPLPKRRFRRDFRGAPRAGPAFWRDLVNYGSKSVFTLKSNRNTFSVLPWPHSPKIGMTNWSTSMSRSASIPAPWRISLHLGPLILLAFAGCSVAGRMSPLLPVERAIVFQPVPYPEGDWSPRGLSFEDAWFQADDGVELHGWYVPHREPRGVLLFCHGNAGNVAYCAETLKTLNERHRLTVMSFDYRGYGRSSGTPSETGVLEDARAARRWLAEKTKTPEDQIIVMGQSLGGAVAADLASKDGARGLVLTSTFTSLPDVGANHLPWLLPRWNMTMRMDSLSKIRQYGGPVLISHGDADEVIPFDQGQTLYEAAPGPKQFHRERGGQHNSPPSEGYHQTLEKFLAFVDDTSPTKPGSRSNAQLTGGASR
jgi:uncharacterized protein